MTSTGAGSGSGGGEIGSETSVMGSGALVMGSSTTGSGTGGGGVGSRTDSGAGSEGAVEDASGSLESS